LLQRGGVSFADALLLCFKEGAPALLMRLFLPGTPARP